MTDKLFSTNLDGKPLLRPVKDRRIDVPPLEDSHAVQLGLDLHYSRLNDPRASAKTGLESLPSGMIQLPPGWPINQCVMCEFVDRVCIEGLETRSGHPPTHLCRNELLCQNSPVPDVRQSGLFAFLNLNVYVETTGDGRGK